MSRPDAAPHPAPPERHETARLVLRKPNEGDAPALFEGFASDPDASRYLTWHPHADLDETRTFVAKCVDDWERSRCFVYALDRVDVPDQPVGLLHLRFSPAAASLGYVVSPTWQGRGIATEAVTCLVEWAMGQPSIFRVSAYCDVDNPASARVLEKSGMLYEGTMRRFALHPNVSDEPRDAHLYARTR